MRFLKWVGSVLVSLIGICVLIGGGIAAAAFGALVSLFCLVGGAIAVVACGIYEHFTHRGR